MFLSKLFIPIIKDLPAEAKVKSHQLMLRAGMIKQSSAGIYSWLPLGFKVMKKIEQIVREEQNAIGAQEMLMPTIQSSEIWKESGRYEDYGEEMLRITDRQGREMLYGPTNEELITDVFRASVKSYKSLPQLLYHIQWKFRDEIRPRFGVMRAREFQMKDAYSFHLDQSSLDNEYKKMANTYNNIFNSLGLNFRKVRADSGEIGGSMSHEYHVLADSGEDEIGYCDEENYAANVEMIDSKSAPNGGELSFARGIEVGHIFQLGDKYSKNMELSVVDHEGQKVNPLMGCYGIGISRIVAASIEQNHDEKGIIWPEHIAPFDYIIIVLNDKNNDITAKAKEIYKAIKSSGREVMIDDRDERAGVKFAEADLIGIPNQIIVSKRGLDQNTIELVSRSTGNKEDIAINELVEKISS